MDVTCILSLTVPINHPRVYLYTNSLSKHTHTMFAVTTTTNVASTAKQCFSGKKTTSSRKSVSSIVKASASSSEEKFDRREMLKNALVASVATVVATPKPVRAIESLS